MSKILIIKKTVLPNTQSCICLNFTICERDNPYHFFRVNQSNANSKIYSLPTASHSVHKGGRGLPLWGLRTRRVCLQGSLHPEESASKGWRDPPPEGLSRGGGHTLWVCIRESAHPLLLVVTSSGDHCSSRYASYWNAFLLTQCGLTVNG